VLSCSFVSSVPIVVKSRRGWPTRVAAWGLCLLFFLIPLVTPLRAQSSSFYQDLADELAARIAAEVGSAARVNLNIVTPAEDDRSAPSSVEAEIKRTLTSKGLRIVDRADGIPTLQIGCSRNLRDRVCVSQMRRGDSRSVIVVTRPFERRDDRPSAPSLALIPLFSQRAPILDVALAGDRLFVLDPERVTAYARADRGTVDRDAAFGGSRWTPLQSRPVAGSRPWPRDVRGTLRVDGETVTAWLPGTVCRGNIDLSRIACADERGTGWPIGIENMGIDAARNHFATPEGLPFFSAAPLDRDADARWLVAADSGELLLLDAARRLEPTGSSGNAVAGLDTACGSGLHVLIASSTNDEAASQTLRLWRVVKRRLVPAAAQINVPGRLTALWSAPGSTFATAVTEDAAAGRYEAFHVRVVCSG
jgi:hypothetical protein